MAAMSLGLHSLFLEVSGKVRWSCAHKVATGTAVHPGKLSISKLADTFYITCKFDSGKASRPLKLTSATMDNISCRNGKFTFYSKVDGGTRFLLQEGDENCLKTLLYCMGEIKKGKAPVLNSQTGKKPINSHQNPAQDKPVGRKVQTPNKTQTTQNVLQTVNKSTNFHQSPAQAKPVATKVQTPNKPQLSTRNGTFEVSIRKEAPGLQEQDQTTSNAPSVIPAEPRTPVQTPQTPSKLNLPWADHSLVANIKKPVLQTVNKSTNFHQSPAQAKPVAMKAQTPNKPQLSTRNGTFEVSIRKEAPGLQEQDQTTSNAPSVIPAEPRTPVKTPHTPSKLNLPWVDHSLVANIKKPVVSDKKNKTNERKYQKDSNKENDEDFWLPSAEKRQAQPDKHRPEDNWSSFGTLHKKTPLNERSTQDASPKRSGSTVNRSVFYGKSRQSRIQLKKHVKKPLSKSSAFASSESSRKSPPSVSSPLSRPFFPDEVSSIGFSNLGNTCYMNAILQSILGLRPFVQELANRDILKHTSRVSLYRCMYNLYCCKDESGSSPKKQNSLRRLKNALSSGGMTKRFSGHLQNDAHEFMNICLDQMKEEVQKALEKISPKPKDDDIEAKENFTNEVCPIVRNFEGCIRKCITCKGCKDLATKDELFNNLSLNIPRKTDSPVGHQMENLLQRFFQEEEVERRCDKCDYNSAIQTLEILALPRVMIFHMHRNKYHKNLGTQEKKSDKISVNRFINIGDFCCSGVKGPTPFSLKTINTSPIKQSSFQENETPSDVDDFVTSKPRRRLDMSMAEETVSPKKKTYDSHSTTEPLPDWLSDTPKSTSDMSLNSRQLYDTSDDEQLKIATMASLQTKQLEDENAMMKDAEFFLNGFDSDSDAEVVLEADCLLEDVMISEKQGPDIDKTKNDGDCGKTEVELNKDQLSPKEGETDERSKQSPIDANNSAVSATNVDKENVASSRKRVSSEVDIPPVVAIDSDMDTGENEEGEKEKVKNFEDSVGTPTKRRKVEDQESMKTNQGEIVDVSLLPEDDQIKRALELSREEADAEQSQIEEAIKLSLEDNSINAELLNFTDNIPEEPVSLLISSKKAKDSSPQIYRLASVVSHIGSSTSVGHYISDVFDIKTEQWTRYNDAVAKKVTEHQVRYDNTVDGYIYFYMHRSCADKISHST